MGMTAELTAKLRVSVWRDYAPSRSLVFRPVGADRHVLLAAEAEANLQQEIYSWSIRDDPFANVGDGDRAGTGPEGCHRRCRHSEFPDFPPDRAAALLRHADPAIRADACRCAPPAPEVVALLLSLLDDLHVAVAEAAACALGRMGRPEARAALSHLIQANPTPEAIAAIAPIADNTSIVILGRIARTQPGLADAVLGALNDIDTPQAAAMATSIRRECGMARGDGGAGNDTHPAF
jgi:hypothetical protein